VWLCKVGIFSRTQDMTRLFVLSVVLLFVSSVASQCTWTNPVTKHYFDLTRACNATGDYAFPLNDQNERFFLQPCCPTFACLKAPSPGPWRSPLCQLDGVGFWHSCGNLSTVTYTEHTGVEPGIVLSYSNGDAGRVSQLPGSASRWVSLASNPLTLLAPPYRALMVPRSRQSINKLITDNELILKVLDSEPLAPVVEVASRRKGALGAATSCRDRQIHPREWKQSNDRIVLPD